MNRQDAKDILPIIQAFAEGKTIEYQNVHRKWIEVKNPSFSEHYTEYRIKPESKYRPFENEKECWEEMQKHQPIGWIKSGELLINIISIGAGITVHNSINNCGYSFKSAFSLKFADGTPFGIKKD